MSTLLEDEDIPRTLKAQHDQIRSGLDVAATQGGEVGKAARRLAQVCFPHFELEEAVVLPIFAKLRDVSSKEALGPMSADLYKQLVGLKDEYESLKKHHKSIRSAVKMLLAAADKEGNHDIAELAHLLSNHERIESDLEVAVHELAVRRSH